MATMLKKRWLDSEGCYQSEGTVGGGSVRSCYMEAVSILGFENCQSFFSATAHVRCTAPARPTPRGRCRSAYSIFYWQNDTAIVISAYNMRATV